MKLRRLQVKKLIMSHTSVNLASYFLMGHVKRILCVKTLMTGMKWLLSNVSVSEYNMYIPNLVFSPFYAFGPQEIITFHR